MEIRRETRYAAAPEEAFAMLVDEEFLRRRATAAHALSYEALVSRQGTTTQSILRQTLPAKLPDIARKLVGETVELTETIEWAEPAADRSRTGRITVEVANAPVRLHGTITLSLSGAQTLQVVQAELKASVPMVGRKLEEAAAPAVTAGIDKMEQLGRDWLAP